MTYRLLGRAFIGVIAGAGLLVIVPNSWGQGSAAGPALAADTSTPRTPDGHPDLNGYWWTGVARSGLAGVAEDPSDPTGAGNQYIPLRNGNFSNLENDGYVRSQSGDNVPLYKPQYWQQILDNEHNAAALDPYIHCMPITPPRLGPPARIVQRQNEVIFFHKVPFQPTMFRDIPVGPVAYKADPDGTWDGDPAAHWDGDTLVVETTGYNDQSWLSRAGYIHGYNMKTIERLHRQGNELTYDVTVEDPEYLQRPWVLPTRRVQPYHGKVVYAVGTNGAMESQGWLTEVPPCQWNDVPRSVGATLG